MSENNQEKSYTWMEHFEDLRWVLIKSFIALMIGSFICYYYSDTLLYWLSQPLANESQNKLFFTGVAEGFFTKIKISLYAGLVVAFPVIIYQIFRFIMPALYPHERRYLLVLIPVSTLLFIAGIVFAYFSVFPVMIKFLLNVSGELTAMITVSQYVSFAITFLIPFGIMFEMPIFSLFLTRIGLINPQLLRSKRKLAVLVCFIIGAVLTPSPDPISQSMMALPMYVLYEISIIVSRFTRAKKIAREAAEEAAWESEDKMD